MTYLLDTHTFLWFILDDNKISEHAKNIIKNKNNNIFISMAILWEIIIKISINKLKIKISFDELTLKQIEINDFSLFQIKTNHLKTLLNLSFYHKDPFDRLLISQAKSEGIPIITKDGNFKKYDVEIIW